MNKRYPHSGGMVGEMRDERQNAIDGVGAAIGGNGKYAAEALARQELHMRGYEEGFKAAEALAKQHAEGPEKHDSDCQNVTAASEAGPASCTCGLKMTAAAGDGPAPGPDYPLRVSNIGAFTLQVREAGGIVVCACGRDFFAILKRREPAFVDAEENAYCLNCRPIWTVSDEWAELYDARASTTEPVGTVLVLRPLREGENEGYQHAKALLDAHANIRANQAAASKARLHGLHLRAILHGINIAVGCGAPSSAIGSLAELGTMADDGSLDDPTLNGARRSACAVALIVARGKVASLRPSDNLAVSHDYLAGFNAAVHKSEEAIGIFLDNLRNNPA